MIFVYYDKGYVWSVVSSHFKIFPTMGRNMGATHSSNFEEKFETHTNPITDLLGSSSLPYILAEAMVNHKKMVHPPCVL